MTFLRSTVVFAFLPALVFVAPARTQDTADGQRVFQSRCAACHGIGPGPARMGPNLAGVFGRAAGADTGARYSQALRNSHIVWNAETLESYLANPRQTVPGTTMAVNLSDAAQRSAVIAYLRSLPPKP
jgi:cytochrome c